MLTVGTLERGVSLYIKSCPHPRTGASCVGFELVRHGLLTGLITWEYFWELDPSRDIISLVSTIRGGGRLGVEAISEDYSGVVTTIITC